MTDTSPEKLSNEQMIKNRIQEEKAKLARLREQKLWNSRLLKLKGEGMDLNALCEKHGFDETEICHAKAARRVLPKDRFDAFIAAMVKEEEKLGINQCG